MACSRVWSIFSILLLSACCGRDQPDQVEVGALRTEPVEELPSEAPPLEADADPDERGGDVGGLDSSAPEVADDEDADVGDGRPVSPEELASALEEVERARRWSDQLREPTVLFDHEVQGLFDGWAGLLAQLSAAGQRGEADRLCERIVALRAHWGEGLFPSKRYNAFLRDRFWVEGHRVEGAQFFEPTPLNEGEADATKLYRLTVYRGEQILKRYYLERRGRAGRVRFALGSAEPSSDAHRALVDFAERQPTYWEVRERTAADLTEWLRQIESTTGDGGTGSP